MDILWLILALSLIVLFFLLDGRLILSFAISSFILFITSFVLQNSILELLLFILLNPLIYITLKYFLPKHFHIAPCLKASMLIGKPATVIQTIPTSPLDSGLVKLDGEIWPAISKQGIDISKGSTVYIHAQQGVRLIVSTTSTKKKKSRN